MTAAPTLLIGWSHYRYPNNVAIDKRIMHYASYEDATLPVCGVAGSFVACDPSWTVHKGTCETQMMSKLGGWSV